ncbi:MAG: hypothetical protein WD377_02405 [Nitriliruptoraceae bacterium]
MKRSKHRTFRELSRTKQVLVVTVGLATTAWQAVMLWDLWHRDAGEIRGSKRRWVAASFVRPLGQIAYYVWGRTPTAPRRGRRGRHA